MDCQDGQRLGRGMNVKWTTGKNLESFPLRVSPESRSNFVLREYSFSC